MNNGWKAFLVLLVLVLGILAYVGYVYYENSILEEGYQIGVSDSYNFILSKALNCEQIPLQFPTENNQTGTINLIAVECLQK